MTDKWECINCGKIFKSKKVHICYDKKLRKGDWQKIRECCIAMCHNWFVPDNEYDALCWRHQDAFDRFHE